MLGGLHNSPSTLTLLYKITIYGSGRSFVLLQHYDNLCHLAGEPIYIYGRRGALLSKCIARAPITLFLYLCLLYATYTV